MGKIRLSPARRTLLALIHSYPVDELPTCRILGTLLDLSYSRIACQIRELKRGAYLNDDSTLTDKALRQTGLAPKEIPHV